MQAKKRRDIPSHPQKLSRVEQNRIVARTVYRLLSWGYPLRSRGTNIGVAEAVGIAARDVFKLEDASGKPRFLGPDRIEQIYKAWYAAADGLASEEGGWRGPDGGRIPTRPWQTTMLRTKPGQGHGLIDLRPFWSPSGVGLRGTLQEFSTELLRCAGYWVHARPAMDGDRQLTAAAQARWMKAPWMLKP